MNEFPVYRRLYGFRQATYRQKPTLMIQKLSVGTLRGKCTGLVFGNVFGKALIDRVHILRERDRDRYWRLREVTKL